MGTTFFVLGSLMGGLGVALGAFGAHALRSRLSADRLVTFETGVRYQMYHSLALVLTYSVGIFRPDSVFHAIAGWLFVAGIVLFSGSLYLLALSGQRAWGAITPIGGLTLIAGWICLALTAL
jgi:uncharacterized membrane protein YgdD (TMEM256/DUF423 family)